MAARGARGLPPLQPLIQTMNPTGTLCYAGAGINALLSAPKMTEFLGGLPKLHETLPNMVRMLALRHPGLEFSIWQMLNRLVVDKPSVEDFLDDRRHHDAQEFITSMLDSVGDLLPPDLGAQWRQIFNINITTEYTCDGPAKHRSMRSQKESILSMPVRNQSNEQPIKSLGEAFSNYLLNQWVERQCGQCDSKRSHQRVSIPNQPKVLFVHYMRFKTVVRGKEIFSIKIKHPITAKPRLTVKNKTYNLVGVLRHKGESANSGHYYFTSIWAPYNITGLAFRINNDDEPKKIDPGASHFFRKRFF